MVVLYHFVATISVGGRGDSELINHGISANGSLFKTLY